jgi:hypothetical protein
MPANAEYLRINGGMDLSSRVLWYLGWRPRPLYVFGIAVAIFGVGALHSSAGLLFGLAALVVRWRATLLINQRSQTITDLAKKAVASSGAKTVGVDLETSDFKVILIGQNRPSPFGVRPKSDYSISAVYICDAFFAVYTGTSFSLPDRTLRLATTGDEVYFRHVSAINHRDDSIEVVLTRGNKSKKIAVGSDPNGAALLGALRSKLRNPQSAALQQVEVQPLVLENRDRDAPIPRDADNDDGQRYCYIRSSKLMEYYADATVLSALMSQLEVPGLEATHNRMGDREKRAAIEAQIDHLCRTPSSFWYGVPAREVLAASIWRARNEGFGLSNRVIADKFYDVSREEDLKRPIARWLEARGQEPYMEIQLGRRRIDVLGFRKPSFMGSPRLTAVELKNSDEEFRRGLDQMGTFAEYAHAVYLACTPAFAADYLDRNARHRSVCCWDPTLLDRKLKQGGFGLLIVERDNVFEVIKPVERAPAEDKVAKVVSTLPPLHKIELD